MLTSSILTSSSSALDLNLISSSLSWSLTDCSSAHVRQYATWKYKTTMYRNYRSPLWLKLVYLYTFATTIYWTEDNVINTLFEYNTFLTGCFESYRRLWSYLYHWTVILVVFRTISNTTLLGAIRIPENKWVLVNNLIRLCLCFTWLPT